MGSLNSALSAVKAMLSSGGGGGWEGWVNEIFSATNHQSPTSRSQREYRQRFPSVSVWLARFPFWLRIDDFFRAQGNRAASTWVNCANLHSFQWRKGSIICRVNHTHQKSPQRLGFATRKGRRPWKTVTRQKETTTRLDPVVKCFLLS